MIKDIVMAPSKILRNVAKDVVMFDAILIRIVTDMSDTMHSLSGIGIAAPQIGVSLRAIILNIPNIPEFVLINPEIVYKSGTRYVTEGCLSIPGETGLVARSEFVRVRGYGLDGQILHLNRAEGLLSQALEHEIDHLNGKLYTDILGRNLKEIGKQRR